MAAGAVASRAFCRGPQRVPSAVPARRPCHGYIGMRRVFLWQLLSHGRRRRGGSRPGRGRGEHALQAAIHLIRAVGHHHHAGVLRVADAHAAAVVDADPLAPAAVFTSALSSGQSAMASEPSRMPSVSRKGEATEPVSRWSRPITMGAFNSPVAHQAVDGQAEFGALAVAQPADARRQALKLNALARQREPARQRLVVREELSASGRCGRCRLRDRRRAPPSGTGRGLRRTAGGCTRARSRGCRRRRSTPAFLACVRMLLP
jgi:hypothetical protein